MIAGKEIIARSEVFQAAGCHDCRVIVMWDESMPVERAYSTHVMVIPGGEYDPFLIWGRYDLSFLEASEDYHARRAGLRVGSKALPLRAEAS